MGAGRIIPGLREAGWSDREISDSILRAETGEEQCRPNKAV